MKRESKSEEKLKFMSYRESWGGHDKMIFFLFSIFVEITYIQSNHSHLNNNRYR